MKRLLLFILVASLLTASLQGTSPGENDPARALIREFRQELQSSVFLFIMGILLTLAGLASILLFFTLFKIHNRSYLALFYFGLFTLLYGVRILSGTYIVGFIVHNRSVLEYISYFITYVIPIPFILVFKQFTGWGWRSSVLWVLLLQTGYTCTAILIGTVSGNPGLLAVPYNNIVVILDIIIGYGNLLFSELLKTAKMRGLKPIAIIIAVAVINENLVGAKLVPWHLQLEELFFFIFVCFLGVIVVLHTARQQKQFQRQLLQADKMIALGTLVSGVAHEINNPNNFILLNSEILARTWKDIEPVLEKHAGTDDDFLLAGVPYAEAKTKIPGFIFDIHQGAGRIKNIVQHLKDYARPTPVSPGPTTETVDVNAVIQSAVHLVGNQLKKYTHHFAVEYQTGLPLIKGNFQRLEQVIINLLLNSGQALTDPNKGITIATQYRENADHLFIRVTDEGVGIPPQHLDQVLNPFFTTKRDSGGLGLGLSTCSAIIKDHGGQIRFDSSPGEGTTVWVTLPVTRESSRSRRTP
jgi:signal transduction histidine kinase